MVPAHRCSRRDKRQIRCAVIADDAGFSIVEVLVAILIFAIAVLGALSLINVANLTAHANDARTNGVNVARQVQEGARAVPASVAYAKLTNGCPAPGALSNPCSSSSDIVTALMSQPGLAPDPSSPPGVWQITRDDIKYTIKVAVCSMDDGSDGYGSRSSGGPYCADVPVAGMADSDADDYKRVTIDVSWGNTRGVTNVRAVALLNSSKANGPSVTCLVRTGDTCGTTATPVITSGTSLNFTATIGGTATSLEWAVDGSYKGTVTPNGATATFTWDIGVAGTAGAVPDGTYEVGATAYDANRNSGTVGTVQIQIDRMEASTPIGFMAGRNTELTGNGNIGGVDLDWLPVADNDVLYYRVYSRSSTGAVALEYQTNDASETAYSDITVPSNPNRWGNQGCTNPPPPNPNPFWYYVVSVQHTPTGVQEGPPTARVDVNGCNHAPNGISGLAVYAAASDGSRATLKWTAPTTADIDAGDSIIGYRIYRWSGSGASVDPAHRYDFLVSPYPSTCSLASGSTVAAPCFVDNATAPGGVAQNYCIRTVDTRMQESACSTKVIYPS